MFCEVTMKNNSSRNQVKLSFGLRDDELLHISEVSSGLKCGCKCAACDAKLIARKGQENSHHFAHYQSKECKLAVETALHLAAKKVLENASHITLPELIIQEQVYGEVCGQSVSKTDNAIVFDSQVAIIESVALEESVKNIVPDVKAYIDGYPLLIEIGVTHFVDDYKKNKIRNLNIASIEIDLSKVARDADFESIRSIVVDSIVQKSWLFHPETEKVRVELRARLETELQIELDKIYKNQQERKQQEDEIRRRKLKQEEIGRLSIQPYLHLLDSYLNDIDSRRSKYVQSLARLPIWKRASSNMAISLQTLPSFLNHPVKGDLIFACDRRAWQSGLFSAFIYQKFKKYDDPYPISVYKMKEWCKSHVPLNHFALNLWSKKELLDPTILLKLQNFDLYNAIREFVRNLEREGFIKYYYQDFYNITNDRFPITEISQGFEESTLISYNETNYNSFTSDDHEHFQDRAAILEFCGGFSRLVAERLAYNNLINSRTQ